MLQTYFQLQTKLFSTKLIPNCLLTRFPIYFLNSSKDYPFGRLPFELKQHGYLIELGSMPTQLSHLIHTRSLLAQESFSKISDYSLTTTCFEDSLMDKSFADQLKVFIELAEQDYLR